MATAKKTATNSADAFDTLTAMNPEMFKEGYEKATQNMSAFVEFQKNSMEALMASAGSVAKAFEKTSSEGAAFAKESLEEGVEAARAAATSKSVQEALDIQSDYVRSTFEKNLKQINKTTDEWVSVTKEASQPLTDQYAVLIEKVQAFRP